MKKRDDYGIIGKKVNRWIVVREASSIRYKCGTLARRVLCECTCQKRTRKVVLIRSIVSEMSQSCGCLTIEKSKGRAIHGLSRSGIRKTYSAMIQRCYNPKCESYQRYGARGVRVCGRWRRSCSQFIADMRDGWSKGMTIERKNVTKGYSPLNCIWINKSKQHRNRRGNRIVSIQGRLFVLSDASKLVGVSTVKLNKKTKHRKEFTINGFRIRYVGKQVGDISKWLPQ
jgi:hypothetical protein